MFYIIFSCYLQTAFAAVTHLAPGQLAVGAEIGDIVSITGKYWLKEREAVDFGLGAGFNSSTILYADYLWHVPNVFGRATQFGRETIGYIGAGGGLGFWSHTDYCSRWNCNVHTNSATGIFARGIVGFEWFPVPTRFGVFADLGPDLILAPGFGATIDVEVGGRYYF